MHYIVEGGAGNKTHQNKVNIIKSASKEDIDFIKNHSKELIQTNRTKFGELKDCGLRSVAVIPIDIMRGIEKVDPEVFKSKKKLHKFLNDFPIFKAAEKL